MPHKFPWAEARSVGQGSPPLQADGSCPRVLRAILEVSQLGSSLAQYRYGGKWLVQPLGAGDSQKGTARAQPVLGCPGVGILPWDGIAVPVSLLRGVF